MKMTRREMIVQTIGIGGAAALTGMAASRARAEEGVSQQPAPETQEVQDMTGKLHIALLQMMHNQSDQQKNLEKGEQYCRWAKERDADIALFPEMWNIGYQAYFGNDKADQKRWQAQAVPTDGEWVGHFRKLAKELDMAIALAYLQEWPGMPRNALSLIDRHGEIVLTYAKVHTCDFANFECSTTPGDSFPVCELDTAKGPVKVGSIICYDREFPEAARCIMLNGAEVMLTPNACLLDDLRLAQFRVRAHENSMCVAMTNYPEPFTGGRSVAYDVAGNESVLAPAEEGIYSAVFDLAAIRKYRETTIWGHAFRRPHRYGALVEPHDIEVFRRQNAFGEPFKAADR